MQHRAHFAVLLPRDTPFPTCRNRAKPGGCAGKACRSEDRPLQNRSGYKIARGKENSLALLALNGLFGGDGTAARTFAGTRVGMGALAAHGKIATMADSAVRLNFNEAADIHLNLLAEIAFDAAFLFDDLADVIDFILGQIANFLGMVDVGLRRDLAGALLPDAVDGGQADPQAFLGRKVDSCYACHVLTSPVIKNVGSRTKRLTLALLVFRIGANNAHHAAPVDDLAFVANFLDRCPYFHFTFLNSIQHRYL